MELSTRQELFEYYNERAPEYEDFYWGDSPPRLFSPDVYKNDTMTIRELLPGYVKGKCLDIACGTGFWLPVYEKNCTAITLIDQSAGVLAECRKKIKSLGIEGKTRLIRDEVFGYTFKTGEFDSALIGFLVSHLNDNELYTLFNLLRFVIIDSAWNDELIKMGRSKTGMINRSLKDGREFEIYKRYFNEYDLRELAKIFSLSIDIEYWGKVFFLADGSFHDN